MTELRTERLLLRDWRDDDLEPWAAMNADPLVREFLGGPIDRDRAAAAIAHYRAGMAGRGWGWWAVEVVRTGEFIGFAGLDPIEEGAPVAGVEIGWRLARGAWGHGYATEAARPCMTYGFESIGLEEILAIAHPGNVRSHAVMRRLGMTYDTAADFTDEDGPKVVYRTERARWKP